MFVRLTSGPVRAAALVAVSFFVFAASSPSSHARTRKHSSRASRAAVPALPSRAGTTERASDGPVTVGRLGTVTADKVPINAGREQYGRLLSRVDKGTNLTVTGQTDTYYAVMMVDHSVGFIAKDKVQLLDYEITADRPLTAGGAGPIGQAMVQNAVQYMGVPYLWGGTTSNGIDCSGFVRAVYNTQSLSLPRTAAEQAAVGYDVPLRDLSQWQVGDRMYFICHHSYIDHTGMYIGNGYFIHSHGGVGVSVTRVDDPYYWKTLVAVRRSSEMLQDAQPNKVTVVAPDMEASEAR
ncbi:MAG TPA: C40 family peptidase [Capsulimonadaceae bacterium]